MTPPMNRRRGQQMSGGAVTPAAKHAKADWTWFRPDPRGC